MKNPLKLRLAGFIIVIALGTVLIGWTERHAWRQTDQLQRRFKAMEQGGFHLADHLDATVLKLNNSLFRFDQRENPADRKRFFDESGGLEAWLASHWESADSEVERELLREIQAAFRDYQTNALLILRESELSAGPGSAAALFERTEQLSGRLVDLGRKLAAAQQASLHLALADAQESLSRLKLMLALSLGLLIVSSLAIAFVVYREMIAPLRVKLVEARALAEQKEKLASLGALAAGVAHEIRNPLTAIKARLFTQQKLLTSLPEALEDNEFIGEEITRLDETIKNFLLFARPSEPRWETLRLTSPMREVSRLMSPELARLGITLKEEYLADPEIKADPQQIRQVLINLVKNAAESMDGAGSITLRSRTKPGRGAGRAAHVAVLEVEDNGKGIPLDVQSRIFDPFFTTKETGTGLGLTVAMRMLEKHGGALEYHSSVGRGSVFSIILPLAQKS